MKFAERLVPILFIIFCFVYFPQTLTFSADWRAYPQVLLVILFILCLFWLLIEILYKRSSEHHESNIVFARVICTVILTLIYILMLNIVGFYLMTAIFISTLMYFLGIKEIKIIFGISVFFTILLYIGFSIFLGVPTPQGILF